MMDNEGCQGGGGCCDGPEKHSRDDANAAGAATSIKAAKTDNAAKSQCGENAEKMAAASASSQETCPVLSSRMSRQEYGFAGCANARETCGAATPGLEKDLLSETLKWQAKAEDLFATVCGDGQFLENISAYIADSHYFLEKNDLIRAFEAVIWAWAWMEIGLLKGILQERK